VETEEILGISAFVVTMAVLISASISDWKKREVGDWHWAAIGSAGLVTTLACSIGLTGFRWEYICLAAGTSLILLDIFSDREFNPFLFYLTAALLFIVPLCSDLPGDIAKAWISIPVCYAVYLGMYALGIVRGGADVKCLVVLSVMFPMYPHFLGFPLINIPGSAASHIFVFSLSVLFLAAVMTVPLALYFAARNAREGDFSGRMFSGYRMKVSDAETANVWPLEDIVGGELGSVRIPDEEETAGIYARLRDAGRETVWVTPMIPFVITITAATAVIALVGNPLFLIF
jgi:preflagellin peptidase FlaK